MRKLLVLCGGSGAGKTTIQHYLEKKYSFSRVLTHTTRRKRRGEKNGIDYYFETKESFFQRQYLEYIQYDGNLYGSSVESLLNTWGKNDKAVIVLDTKGVLAYRQKLLTEKVIFWYVAVTDKEIFNKRILKRGEKEEIAQRRLRSKEAVRDMQMPQQLRSFCEIILNDNWEKTKEEIKLQLQQSGF
ncbi:guanylate kinase [Liquorilactobacillus oeni]|uniref:Guanylate kinase n=1 Tax=Liquorilactobacillus oeni DSM 19972 TaxID=1423777 RepID=A0A0R1MC44_9LACO|nr:guanylate kinase [Liquorilactobacillus oeni]KRL05663.1 Guanylate kinase [Liquorilactobacillus oeni DSM 19972]